MESKAVIYKMTDKDMSAGQFEFHTTRGTYGVQIWAHVSGQASVRVMQWDEQGIGECVMQSAWPFPWNYALTLAQWWYRCYDIQDQDA